MKISRRTVLIIAILINTSLVFGQKIFTEGFIVKQNGDTLNGLIQYNGKSGPSQKCVFKRFDIAVPVTYYAKDILAYGYKEANLYESKNVNGIQKFIECYVKGKISLYGIGNKLFITKGDKNLIELSTSKIILYNNEGTNEYLTYLDLLKDYTKDAEDYQIPNKFALKREYVAPVIYNYNIHTNTATQKYSFTDLNKKDILEESSFYDSKSQKHIGFTSSISFSSYTVGVTNKNNVYNNTLIQGDPYNDWSFGAFYMRQVSRKNRNFWFKTDILITSKKRNYNYTLHRILPTEIQLVSIESSFTDIKIPIALQFIAQSYSFAPFISAGVSLNLSLSNNFKGELSVPYATYKLDEEKLYTNRNLINYFVSVGVKQKIHNNVMFFVEAKGELMLTSHETRLEWTSNTFDYYEFDYFFSPDIEISNISPFLSLCFGFGF